MKSGGRRPQHQGLERGQALLNHDLTSLLQIAEDM